MADRYQDKPFPAGGYGRGGDQRGAGQGNSDPLAELARLIGQTDPFGTTGRANPAPAPTPPPLPRNPPQQQYQPPQYQPAPPQYDEEPEVDEERPAGPPPWMQRANQREIHREQPREVLRQPEPQYEPEPVHAVHPLHRYAAPPVAQHDYQEEPLLDEGEEQQLDPSRYDDALYGQLETDEQDFQRDPAYPDDPYAYQDGYEEEVDEGVGRRRGGLMMVLAVLALAVVGTGGAFAYRNYFTSSRSGEVPIIRADNTPTKIVPAPADSGTKVPDRMVTGDATEKLVPREETPIDVNSRAAGPRVVFPPLNPNSNPPAPSSVSTSTMPLAPNTGAGPTPSNGTLPSSEPRKVRTLTVRGDQPDAAAPANAPPPAAPTPQVAAKPTKGGPRNPPTSANASANAPLSLSPQGAQDQAPPEPRTRVAATNPAQTATAAPSAGAASGGGYLVSVSSQQSETDAQSSYRMLQGKFPTQLGSRSPVIRRTDLGDKVVYRAMVGPFGTSDEAKQFCVDYKAAGGQCFVPKN